MSESDDEGEEEPKQPEMTLSEVEQRRRQRLKKKMARNKSTQGDRVLDDFIGKRMGKGYVFYGERTAEIDDETFNTLNEPTAEMALAEMPLKPNAILVVGATGETGQWVVLDLLSKGFNIRIFSRDLDKTEKIFGPDGTNSDIFLGDVKNLEDLELAAEGAQAVIYCAGSRAIVGGNSFQQVDCDGVKNLVEACKKSGSVKKIVLLSSIGASDPSQMGFLEKLAGSPLKWKSEGEAAVRESGIDYTIVRAAGLKNEPGGMQDVQVGQGDSFGQSSITRMDVAEALVQSLVNDATSKTTFEIKNTERFRAPPESYNELDPKKSFEMEIMEDIKAEAYWNEKLEILVPDAS
eukprot:CAMPEP_0117755738 /NCGR_PEP_ID=MMETSP0947-20121206/13631_1 /TAXON_ID=44440 /ORGANISM="Chattonella subsalsa, Strain CCMP2191" /LENGTH=348 /DNA_ID=CAMNT_0005575131 /DNA_START=254 /DNA_END=1300 /DNA_ORIENTATION=-